MALIPRDKITELVSASAAKETADSAANEIDIQVVAAAINNAANTGQYKVSVSGILPATADKLKSLGYEVITYENNNLAKSPVVIKWGN